MRLFEKTTMLEEAVITPLTTEARLEQLEVQEQRWLGILTHTTHDSDMIVGEVMDIQVERAALTVPAADSHPLA